MEKKNNNLNDLPNNECSNQTVVSSSECSNSESTAQATVITNPVVGHIYIVKRLDGECLPAEVLETREVGKEKRIEYFVHFENCT